jgi:MFS family permease
MPERAAGAPLFSRSFLILSAATLAYFVADGMTLPVSPRFAAGPLGADSVGVGLSIGAFSLTALLLRPFTGTLSDRFGRRPMILVGAAFFFADMLLTLAATSIPVFVAARLLGGAADACVFVASFAAAADLAPEKRRGEAMSYFSLALYVGIAIGPPIGEALLGWGSFAAVWIASAATVALAGLLALAIPDTRATGGGATTGRLLHPAGLAPGLVLLAGGWGMAGFFAFVSLYADSLGLDGASPYLALYAAIVIVLRIVAAKVPDRVGARRLAGSALVVAAVGLALMGTWGDAIGLLVGTALYACGVAFMFPALGLLVVSSVPAAERGGAEGTFTAFLDLAFGLGPVAAGVVAAGLGYAAVFSVSAGVALVGFGFLLAITRPGGRAAPG